MEHCRPPRDAQARISDRDDIFTACDATMQIPAVVLDVEKADVGSNLKAAEVRLRREVGRRRAQAVGHDRVFSVHASGAARSRPQVDLVWRRVARQHLCEWEGHQRRTLQRGRSEKGTRPLEDRVQALEEAGRHQFNGGLEAVGDGASHREVGRQERTYTRVGGWISHGVTDQAYSAVGSERRIELRPTRR